MSKNIILFSVFTPIFIGAMGIYRPDSDGFAIPVGFFVVFVYSMAYFLKGNFIYRKKLANQDIYVLCLAISMVFFAIYNNAFGFGIELILIYSIPMFCGYYLGRELFLEDADYAQLRKGGQNGSLLLSLFAFLHVISSFINFGISGAFANRGDNGIFHTFGLYQKYIYYPTILAYGFMFIQDSKFKLKKMILLIFLVDMLICSSRESLLIVLLSTVHRTLKYKNTKYTPVFLLTLGILICAFILNTTDLNIDNQMVFVKKIVELAGENEMGNVDISAGRLSAIISVMGEFDIQPLFLIWGDHFSSEGTFMGTPHNQYVEWFIRGGGVFFVPILMFIFTLKKKLALLSKEFFGLYQVLVYAFILSCNVNTPFRVPLTSVMIWVLIGGWISVDKNLRFKEKNDLHCQ